MHSYIVRIYHHDEQNPAMLEGVVEIVESGAILAFHDGEGLWKILVSSEAGAAVNNPVRRATGRKRPQGQ